MDGITSLKRKRTVSTCDADDEERYQLHGMLSSASFELQCRVYETTVVKLKTAAPLTRSQRRREPPLRRTVLMFNTLRLIEKNCSPSLFVYTGNGSVPSLSVAAAGVGQSALIRPQVAVQKDFEMDVLPSLPSDYLFSCSFDRLDSECFCHQLHESASRPALLPLPETSAMGSESSATDGSDEAPSSGLFVDATTSVGVVEDLPIITFTSVLDFDSPALMIGRKASTSERTTSATSAVDMPSNFDLSTFDWPDFDTPSAPTPPLPSEGHSTELPLSPLVNVDFDYDLDDRFNIELSAAGLQTTSGTSSGCSHSVSCNHRNELLSDELDHIVQQILVGT